MDWTHGQNERRQITEKSRDKERRLQKTRKTTAKMGGLPEERPKKGRRRRKVERKNQQQRVMEENNAEVEQQSDKWSSLVTPLNRKYNI